MKRRLTSLPDPIAVVAADSSAPEVLDLAAEERDALAESRDAAAELRDARPRGLTSSESEAERAHADRKLAARDRAAAALDRHEAALDRLRAQQYLERSYRDELTGALQRMAGRDQLAQAVARAHRTREPLAVAFLDVDHLKSVNDITGHAAGDRLLRSLAAALRGGLRSYDLVVRYGGDEFVCALPDTEVGDAVGRFDDVRRQLDDAYPQASFSIGVVALVPDEELDDVVARADRAMYETRRNRA